MKRSRLLILSAFAALTVCLTGCGESNSSKKTKVEIPEFKDSTVYNTVLPEYKTLFDAAHQSTNNAERFVKFAETEAYLLDSAVILPMTTEGGRYGISRVLPYSGPYARYGSDSSKYKGYKIIKTANNDLLLTSRRDELKADWRNAVERGFDETNTKEAFNQAEAEKLAGWGISEYHNTYTTLFSSMPETLDYLATSHAGDADVTTNLVDGLYEHDRFGDVVPALAAEMPQADATKTVYTVKLKQGLKWVYNDGREFGEVKADDFVAGFQHLLDAKGGSEDIVNSIVVGAADYSSRKSTDFSTVGVKAIDEYTIQYSFLREIPYINSLLTFSIFQPLNREFFISKGGAFGIDEFKRAKALASYKYGTVEPTSILYNGGYRLNEITAASGITYVKNNSYWDLENITLNQVNLVYASNVDELLFFDNVVKGQYAGMSLSTTTLEKAREKHGDYIFKQDTATGTFFGAFNLNRRTFSLSKGRVASPKNDAEKALTKYAVLNKNFRKAFIYALSKAAWNAISVGEELKENNLRNMLGDPEFVDLPEAYGGYDANTAYGAIVQDKLNARLAANNEAHNWTDANGNPINEAINVSDGVDGWTNTKAAQKYFEIAKEELLTQWGDKFGGKAEMEKVFPIKIDIVYMKNTGEDASIQTFRSALHNTFGRSNIDINMVEAPDQTSYLAATYLAATGEQTNYDFYYGSGWIPDYGDPATFLETMVPGGAGYMTKTLGLW